jgi:hypothetical protein
MEYNRILKALAVLLMLLLAQLSSSGCKRVNVVLTSAEIKQGAEGVAKIGKYILV